MWLDRFSFTIFSNSLTLVTMNLSACTYAIIPSCRLNNEVLQQSWKLWPFPSNTFDIRNGKCDYLFCHLRSFFGTVNGPGAFPCFSNGTYHWLVFWNSKCHCFLCCLISLFITLSLHYCLWRWTCQPVRKISFPLNTEFIKPSWDIWPSPPKHFRSSRR